MLRCECFRRGVRVVVNPLVVSSEQIDGVSINGDSCPCCEPFDPNGQLHKLSESSGFSGTMNGGMSISVVESSMQKPLHRFGAPAYHRVTCAQVQPYSFHLFPSPTRVKSTPNDPLPPRLLYQRKTKCERAPILFLPAPFASVYPSLPFPHLSLRSRISPIDAATTTRQSYTPLLHLMCLISLHLSCTNNFLPTSPVRACTRAPFTPLSPPSLQPEYARPVYT